MTYLLAVTNSQGDHLQLTFENEYKRNKSTLMKHAKAFGVAWLGDRATIKCMPLLNMLILCGEEPLLVICIFDCRDHKSKWGKEDAEYIGQLVNNKVTDLILSLPALIHSFLMLQEKVQNGREILCATFP